jgi:hypothetical protein
MSLVVGGFRKNHFCGIPWLEMTTPKKHLTAK